MTSELISVAEGNENLSKGLYKLLSAKTGNVVFSPFSIHTVLSLALQGSATTTKEALIKTLQVKDQKTAAVGYETFFTNLQDISGVTFLMANKAYLMEGYLLKKTFNEVVTKSFKSEVENVNFANSGLATNLINTWVENQTNKKITNLFKPDELDGSTRLVLINALYFKGDWLNKFDPEHTIKKPFYSTKDTSHEVDMMRIKKKYDFKDDEELNAKVLIMPYKNKDFNMVFVLPNEKDGISELENKISTLDLERITDETYHVEVEVEIPKFRIEQTIDLNDTLSKLGLEEMFDSRCDFSEMIDSNEKLVTSKVLQKVYIEVNEEGAEAAAVTAIKMCRMSMSFKPPPKTFHVDHPFIFALMFKTEGKKLSLFQGRISELS